MAVVPLPAVAPLGPIPTSEEEAERGRYRLDTLATDDTSWLGRRQALVEFYCTAMEQVLDRGHFEDAFQLLTKTVTLFEAAELVDPSRPPTQPRLLGAARRIDQAFSRRGAHAEAMLALAVQIALSPAEMRPVNRFEQLAAWLKGPGNPAQHAFRNRRASLEQWLQEAPASFTSDMEHAYRVWPTTFLRKRLVEQYRRESQPGDARNPHDFLRSLMREKKRRGSKELLAYKLAQVYLRASLPKEALAEIEKLGRLSDGETLLGDLLRDTLASPARPLSSGQLRQSLTLAKEFVHSPEDLDVGLQVCRDVFAMAPDFVDAAICIGELAHAQDRKGLAMWAFLQAQKLAPADRTVWQKLGLLYLEQLSMLVSEERTGEMNAALREIESHYAAMKQRFSDTTPEMNMAMALFEVGRGYFNVGSITDAEHYFSRSVQASPTAQPYELLGMIHFRRKHADEAIRMFEKALSSHAAQSKVDVLTQTLYSGRLGRLMADAQDLRKEGSGAELRKQSLGLLNRLQSEQRLRPERRAEAEIERGKMFYSLGEREQSLLAFRLATDQIPSAEETNKGAGQLYADMLAFLVQRGELSLSLDIYHRALLSPHLGEPLKVYCSMWLLDLAERAGQVRDPLATAFLQSVQGGKWHATLAHFQSGRLDAQELVSRADTQGKLAEAHFYLAQAALRRGDAKTARELWNKVLQSNMFGFFEFEMAGAYLEKGAPTQPRLDAKNAKPTRRAIPPSGPNPVSR